MNRTLSTIVGVVLLCACVAHAAEIVIKPTDNAQQKIDASADGDTIVCPDPVNWTGVQGKGNRTYKFAKLSGGQGSTFALTFRNQSNITIAAGSLIENGNLAFETCSRVTIKGVTFKGHRGNRSGNGWHVIFSNKLSDSTISGNRFEDMYDCDTCIFGYDPRNCHFDDNVALKTHEFVHLFWFSFDPLNPWNVTVNRNVMAGVERHPVELQGCAHNLEVLNNHVSGRVSDGINLSIATGGEFGNGSYRTTKNIRVEGNVCDNTGFNPSHWSQCMGIELMGDAICRNNFIVNSGQAIAVTNNSPDTKIMGNKFLKPTKDDGGRPVLIVADPPRDRYIVPKPENFTGNVIVPDNTPVPTVEQTIGQVPVPPPPATQPAPNAPTIAARAHKSMVSVTHTLGATIQKRAGDNVWRDVTLVDGFDKAFSADQISNRWVWFYKATLNGISSPEVRVQLNLDTNPADPAPMPVPPPPQPIGDLVISGKISGVSVDVIYQRKADGTFNPQPTTRPVQPQQ